MKPIRSAIKLITTSLLLLALIFSCGTSKTVKKTETVEVSNTNNTVDNKEPEETNHPMVGNDADEHGCRKSAGYTWSVIDNKCIRPWETGPQLQSLDKTLNASVLFSTDGTRAELFISEEKTSVLLDKNKTGDVFSNGTYELSTTNFQWILKKNGTLIYKSK